MAELVQDNWILFIVALLLGIAVAWWIFVASRRTRVELGEGTQDDAPARRNQALIDAPPATMPVVPNAAEAVPTAIPEAPAPVAEAGDDLTRIKGVGPKVVEQLRALGVTRFAQIAEWDEAEIDRIDARLGRFEGRIRRDNWPAQARLLASGDTAGYEARFGKL